MKIVKRKRSNTFELLIQLLKNREGQVALFLIVALPVTLFLTHQQQDIRQHASELPTDTTPPSITITNPLNDSTIQKGQYINITASVVDNIKVGTVKFYINDILACANSTGSNNQSCYWKVPDVGNTTYTIIITASDTSGNTASARTTVLTQ